MIKNGERLLVFPILGFWLHYDTGNGKPLLPKVLFIASKKRFKKATERNYYKRIMREAYRTSKKNIRHISENKQLQIAFAYIGKDKIPFSKVEQSLQTLLSKIDKNLVGK